MKSVLATLAASVVESYNEGQYGFFHAYSASFTGEGTSFNLGSGTISAPGAACRLCWCYHGFTCTHPNEYQTDLGTQNDRGPLFLFPDSTGSLTPDGRLRKKSCVASIPCNIYDFRIQYLYEGDSVMIKTDCVLDTPPVIGWPS